METKGVVDEEAEAAGFGAAANSQNHEGPAATTMMGAQEDEDGDMIGMAEIRHNQEIEEAKKELEELKGSDDDEACYEGANQPAGSVKPEGASQEMENSSTIMVGQKRSREEANNDTNALDLRALKRQKRMQFMNYYRGDFFGKCCSAVFYELAK